MNDTAKCTASADLTAEEIAELWKAADAATPGPWDGRFAPHGGGAGLTGEWDDCGWPVSDLSKVDGYPKHGKGLIADCARSEDQAFIALARTLVPRLLDMVERQRADEAGRSKVKPSDMYVGEPEGLSPSGKGWTTQ